ncbi:hypothetical protein Oscil6304_1526 [Oscillatoria acuminata PCC 6304]|uniref:Uncharacterized protein n=1 Tax=Oscillatoria acuminata PCC 6304 TaxID=56110 RepID=K9TGH5_9CYAN|nr:hypothetical protein Oscil6304_1526 [Oscillatoria acuminata PCC 6304]
METILLLYKIHPLTTPREKQIFTCDPDYKDILQTSGLGSPEFYQITRP